MADSSRTSKRRRVSLAEGAGSGVPAQTGGRPRAVSELGLAGTDDVAILDRARDDDRVLVTDDHDFVQMLFASGNTSPSLVLVRDIEGLRSAELAELPLEALQTGMADLLTAGAIASLTLDRVRISPCRYAPPSAPGARPRTRDRRMDGHAVDPSDEPG